MGNLMQQGDTFIESKEQANNGYGQNGFQKASSDLPGQKTTSSFLPASAVPTNDWQTRKINADGYVPAHGMKSRNAPGGVTGSIPSTNDVQPVRPSSHHLPLLRQMRSKLGK